MPLFALLTTVAWRRKVSKYPAHLYLALHLHAAWFGALAVSTVATIPFASTTIVIILGVAAYPFIAWYGLVTARRVFDDSWGKTIAKAAAVAAVYSTSLVAVSLLMLGYALATL